MAAPLLVFLFVFVASVAFGQDAAPVKAGDRAPEIDWTKIMQSPESAKYQPSLTGQYTVLQFLPSVTPNAQAIDHWNELIAKFRDQPLQFVWIASEKWSAVQPFLREHPMNGWLLIDEKKEAARAYRCEMGGDVIVDPSGKIVGFMLFPDPQQLAGVLDGKAVAIARGTEDDQVFKLLEGGKVRLETEPERWEPPHAPEKPGIPTSYEVHISPSKTNGTEGSSGPDFWVQRGFDLKTMVSMVYEKDLSRLVLPKALDNDDKFDFVVVLPKEEDEQTIHQLVQRAIEKQFKVSAAVESKPAEVYVMTAIKGKTPPAKTGNESFGGGFTGASGFEFSLPEGTPPSPEVMKKAVEELLKRPENIGLSNISAGNTTMDGSVRIWSVGSGDR
jgi:peroxiredoxin